MKKYLLFVIAIVLLSVTGGIAQEVTYSMNPPTVATQGENICIPITVADFSAIGSLQQTYSWDNTVLSFTGINNINPALSLAQLDVNDFNLTNAANGIISLDWEIDLNLDPCSVTLADGATIFELCFTAIGAYGSFSDVNFLEVITGRVIGNCSYIHEDPFVYDTTIDGFVSIAVEPIIITGSSVSGNQGGTACVEFTVEDFTNISTLQFTVAWDTGIVTHASHSSDIIATDNFGEAFLADGYLTVSYTAPPGGQTLADGTVLFRVCFNIVGDCDEVSAVAITSDKTPLQASNTVAEIGVLPHPGSVEVSCYIPGAVSFCIGDNTVEVGEVFCVPVTVQNFDAIMSMDFDINWDPNQIHYSNTNGYNATLGITGSNFNTSQTGTGTLSFQYGGACIPYDLADDEVLFNICFIASGNPGTSSVSIPNGDGEMIVSDQCVVEPLVTNVCSGNITINTPVGITITAPTMSVLVGDEFCVPLTVRDFNQIDRTNYSVLWDPGVIEYVNITNINPTLSAHGLDIGDFDLSNVAMGSFCLNWVTFIATDLPADAVLFNICYRALDNPGNCSPIIAGTGENGCTTLITNENSNGENIGLHSNDGNICVLDEIAFGLTIENGSGAQGDTVCVDVLTTDFTQLTQFGFSLSWDESILQLNDVTTTGLVAGFDENDFDLSGAGTGTATASWTSADHPAGGVTLPDSTALFTLCFTVLGNPPDCATISFGSVPEPIVVNSEVYGTSNIGMTGTNGQICVAYNFSIADVNISPVTCPDTETGAIDITIQGGDSPYTFSWTTPSGNFFTEDIENIAAGTCNVTITDSNNQQLEATYEIPLSSTIPVAVAGDDQTKTCDEATGTEIPTLVLDGTGTTTGSGYTYLWTSGVGGTVVSGENTLMPEVSGSGNFVLHVTETASNCVVTDTVHINPAVIPTADAGGNQTIVCSLTLDGTNSYSTPPLNIEWTTLTGNIVSGGNTLTPTIDKPGAYRLTLTIPTTYCKSSDFIVVSASSETPFADAGTDTTLNCNGDPVTIGGDNTSSGAQFTYAWSAIEGGQLCDGTPSDMPTASACAVGTYILAVTNTDYACTKTDTVMVFNGPGSPEISAGIDTALTCAHNTIFLQGEGPIDANFSVSWTASDGGIIASGADTYTPEITHTGTYLLTVHDINNDCSSTDAVVVGDNTTPPAVNAGADTVLNCTYPTINLNGSPFGVYYSFEWEGTCSGCISDPQIPFPTIDDGGTFTLTVTDTRNGCSGTDEVIVGVDTLSPTAIVAAPSPLTCADTVVTLDGTGSTTGNNISYLWTSSGGNPITGSTTLTPTVTEQGTYLLTVTNEDNGCTASESADVAENTINILAYAGIDVTIEDCVSSEVMLNASVTPAGIYNIQWSALTTGTIVAGENSLTPTVNGVGFYEIFVSDEDTGCSDRDTVEVRPNDNIQLPEVTAGNDQAITSCIDSTSEIHATVSQSDDFSISWIAPSGGMVTSGQNSLNPTVEGFGNFIIQVTDNDTHCPGYDTIAILDERVYPVVGAGDDITLTTCGSPTDISLHGTVEPAGDYTVNWTSEDGNTITDAGTLNPTVNGFGTYVLTATDNTTQCAGSDNVEVIDGGSGTFEVNAGEDVSVTSCTNITSVLHGSVPGVAHYTVQWTAPGGNDITGATTLDPTVEGFGLFIMEVTDTDSDCTATDTVEVIDDSTPLDGVSAGEDLHINNCNQSEFMLQGTVTSTTDYTVSWSVVNTVGTIVSGGNTLTPTVNGFDSYALTVTDNITQCRGRDTVQVWDEVIMPGADAGMDIMIECGGSDTVTITGSGDDGDEISHIWSTVNGIIITDPAQYTVDVKGAGVYVLTVENGMTGCAGIDTMEVRVNTSAEPAQATYTGEDCSTEILLQGNLPDNTTGIWTTVSDVNFDDPALAETMVSGLESGTYEFVWTLSTADCPNYSSAVVSYSLPVAPVAVDDNFILMETQLDIDIDLILNDIVTTDTGKWSLTLLSTPQNGTLTPLTEKGQYNYTPLPDYAGVETFSYSVCLDTCQQLCDTALVGIEVLREEFHSADIPTGITPNGDGKNDMFVLEVLTDQTVKYPDNEIIIFNRWGDVVYRAKPYHNDWQGTNNAGQPLPEATYYYVLRLDLSKSIIIRGNVTILK